MISPQAAIIYSMVLSAAADGDLANDEIDTIKTIINGLPVFDGIIINIIIIIPFVIIIIIIITIIIIIIAIIIITITTSY